MHYQKLLQNTVEELKRRGFEREANKIKYAVDIVELKSCLREYIFGSDAKVDRFVSELKKQ